MRPVSSLVVVMLLVIEAGCASRTQSVAPPQASPELTRFIEVRCPGREETCGQLVPSILQHLEVINHISKPSQELWVPYAESQPFIRSDAERVWHTGMLESLWVEVTDDPYPNGIPGKRIVFNVVERSGVRAVPTGPPSPPAGFEEPPPGHERLYP